jgi:peroxiredoxin
MNKFFLLIPVWLMVACSASSSQETGGIRMSGQVGFPQDGHIVLSRYTNTTGDVEIIDTLELRDDYTFDQRVVVPQHGYYKLDFYGKQVLNIILGEDDMIVNVDGNNQNWFSEIKGSKDHNYLIGFQQAVQQFQQSPEITELQEIYVEAQNDNDTEVMDSLRNSYLQLDQELKMRLLRDADTMRTSLGVVEVLRNQQYIDPDVFYDFMKEYAARVEKDMPNTPVADDFVTMVKNMEKLAIGAQAPEISLPNPDGEIVPLSSLRGKYVLVDFWAQWCRPCRMENPNVVEMYEKYNVQGFEVYGVSLDRTKEKWLQAIEEDGLHWTQVSDLKYWKSEAAQTYNISAIPFSLLLDPDGKIIAKNLRGPYLRQRLSEIFDQ